MPEVPILRGGRPYESLSTLPLTDLGLYDVEAVVAARSPDRYLAHAAHDK